MSFKRIYELAKKFAENEAFQTQREKLSLFYGELYRQYRALLNEMEGDIFTMKAKEFNRDSLKEFALLWKNLLEIFKKLDEEHPYESAQKLIRFVDSKLTKSNIINLENAIQQHLKRTEIEFQSGPMMQHPKVNSLRQLLRLVKHLQTQMESNPLIQDPGKVIDEPTKMLSEKEDYPTPQLGPEDKTRPGKQ